LRLCPIEARATRSLPQSGLVQLSFWALNKSAFYGVRKLADIRPKGALIEDTYLLFGNWRDQDSLDSNFDRVFYGNE
jgi:hypothetical protein